MRIQKKWAFPVAVLLSLTVGTVAAQAQLRAGPSQLGAQPAGFPSAGHPQGLPAVAPSPPLIGAPAPLVAPVMALDPATGAYYAPPGMLPVVAGPDPHLGGATPPTTTYEDSGPYYDGEAYGDQAYGDEMYDDGEAYDEEYYARHQRLGLVSFLLPYDEGGICAPRWWDAYADAVSFRRENVSRTVNFSSDGILGPIVLSSDNLDFDNAYGFRAGLATQLSAGSNIEFNFLGALNFSDRAQVTSDTNNLYHVFSEYGANPFLGFPQTDQAFYHDIAYSSNLNSFEMSFRRRWQGRNCRLQGSWLAGVRYVSLNEDFVHNTRGTFIPPLLGIPQPQSMTYTTSTINSLTGFQIGGDGWLTLVPGFRVGGELKAGIYGNYTHQNTSIVATTIDPPPFTFGLNERTGANGAAFVAEMRLGFTYRVNYRWTVRAGYDFLYLDGVALAIENFNSAPPFISVPPFTSGQRDTFFNNNGSVFLHGATLGLEYLW